MPLSVFILGTLGFAVCGALLYVWGYRRSRRMPGQLQQRMGLLLDRKILACLAASPQGATLKTLASAIRGVGVGSGLDGYRLKVDDHLAAAEAVVARMVETGQVREETRGKSRRYYLPEGNGAQAKQ